MNEAEGTWGGHLNCRLPPQQKIYRGLIVHSNFMSTDTDDCVNSTLLVFVGSWTVILFSYSNGSSLAPFTPEHMRIGGGRHCQQPDSLSRKLHFCLTPALCDFEGIS